MSKKIDQKGSGKKGPGTASSFSRRVEKTMPAQGADVSSGSPRPDTAASVPWVEEETTPTQSADVSVGSPPPDTATPFPWVEEETMPTQSADVSVGSPPPDKRAQRLQRIEDYLDAALQNPLPEVAVIGGANADLALLQLSLNESMAKALADCNSVHEYLDAVPEAMEMMITLCRQMERGMRLSMELARNHMKSQASA